MRQFLTLGWLLFITGVYAQEVPLTDVENLLDKQKMDVDLANTISSPSLLRDSIVRNLVNHSQAQMIDSIWQVELFKSSLYSDPDQGLLEVDYKETVQLDLSTDTLIARLKRLDAKTPFQVEYNPVLEKVIHSYLKRHKKSMENLMALSTYYFPMFEQGLDKHNIPLEIKYLAIVESTLNPRARSRMGATGLWQFMFSTGKMHGLDVSSYVDERMDPVKSTDAAAMYLSTLYKMFGDWDLVLASYNSGPGNVSKAIRRSGGATDYWKLRPYLPGETAGYVPAFLATMYVFEYAEEHGFQVPNPNITFFETDTIRTKRMLTFDQISETTGVEKELLQFLNPSYKLDVIPHIEGRNYSLRLPRGESGLFVSNEEDIYKYATVNLASDQTDTPELAEEDSMIRYRVKSGDFLGKIADKYGVSVSNIRSWNDLRSDNLRVGQRLSIHPRRTPASSNARAAAVKTYTVRQGDSLWSISRKFQGVTIKQLRDLNDLSNNSLRPGMELKIYEG